MSIKSYDLLKTETGLITIKKHAASSRTASIKESTIDSLQLAYMELKDEFGANAPITAQQLCAKANVSLKTFEQNFCGGITGLLSICEHVVTDRFSEAVESINGSLSDKLTIGLRSLYFVNAWSKYNTVDRPIINMNLRTRFCVKMFGDQYWLGVIRPLLPAIDTFIVKNELYNGYVPEEAKDYLYSLFASSFRWIADLMTQEDISRYTDKDERNKYLKQYVDLSEKLLAVAVRNVLECRYRSGSDFFKIVERINGKKENEDKSYYCKK